MSEMVINFCWMGIHKWSSWKDVADKECGNHQMRICEHCEKKQYTDVMVGHRWSKWDKGHTTNVYDKDSRKENGDYPLYRLLTQRRTCDKCGQIETHEIKTA